jgi:hypothetical protein
MGTIPRPDDDRAGGLEPSRKSAGRKPSRSPRHPMRAHARVKGSAEELERLSDSVAFAAELERLAALAPEPWATKLRAILDEELAR